jgi:ABC-type transport system involved in cytochrome bd biosynthesis fused ATPase/permease subunit
VKSTNLRLLLQRGGSRRLFFVSVIGATIWSAIIVVSALVLARVIVAVINLDPSAISLIGLLAGLWAFRAIFQSGFEYWCSRQAVAIKQQIRTEVTSALDTYAHVPPSIISTLLVKGLNSLDIYLGRFLPQLFFASITPFVVIATLFVLDPLSGFIAVFTLPLIPIFGALIGKYTADSVNKKWRTLGSLSAYFEDSLRGFVTLKIFGRHKSQGQRIEEMGDRYTQETMKVLKISFLSALALELCATISVALIAVSVGLRLVDSKIGFTTSLAVLILAPEVYFPLRNAASLFHASADGTEAFEQLTNLQADKSHIPAQLDVDFSLVDSISWKQWGLHIKGRLPCSIEARTINSGEIHFIVGESGIGKSTFALNLLGIRNDAGVIVDSNGGAHTLNAFMKNSWFKTIGWVPQQPQLATGTLRKQFQLISPTIEDASIIKMLARCGLEVTDLPNGLETQLGAAGESSNAASGGQIRKIAIARALVSQPQVLIADEPTADLDSESADKVMKTLRGYATSGSIVICITHDVSIVRAEDSQQSFVVTS